jgi:hypothetical protein
VARERRDETLAYLACYWFFFFFKYIIWIFRGSDSAQTQTLLRDGKRRQSAARSVIVASEGERPTGRRTFLDAYFATLFLFIVVLNEG